MIVSPLTADALHDLALKQVGFYAFHDCPSGQSKVGLSAAEVVEYASDPAAFLARHYGVTRSAYLGWHACNYHVFCAGFTKAGKPCRNVVPDLSSVLHPKVWADGQGGHCSQHA